MPPAVEAGRIRGRDVSRRFEIRLVKARSLKETLLRRSLPPKREIRALQNVDIDVAPGETFGVVGQNGSGKSTLLKLLAGVFEPSSGSLEVGGRVGSLIEVGAGFHPEFTGSENVYLNAAIHGIARDYVDEHLDEIIAFAELEDFADVPVKNYSTGMFMRLGFSVAMHIQPDVLLVDEVLAVGDEDFQQKCFGRIWDFKRAGGTIVFVSHDPRQVERLCDHAILLEHGEVVERGEAAAVLRAYHRRLAERRPEVRDEGAIGRSSQDCSIREVRAIAGDQTARDRFLEGEPFVVEAWLRSETGVEGAIVGFTFRDEGGRLVASQTIPGVGVDAGALLGVRLHLHEPPLRDGRFTVGVSVLSHDRDRELASADRALQLTLFSRDGTAEGPIRLGATWEFAEQPRREAEAQEPVARS
jgi:ABC-type polysaccharide/polyol phosphate transport system ATPase subunit